ncbi:MAG: hypothetical protein PHG66_01255 [Candidatus Colwellbacteria bacterium]|nr:hypothetical protein [Candidatus Colwellbacteria bacterium]
MLKDHNHDLIHQLSETSDALWRMDDYINNAEGCDRCQSLWKSMKSDLEKHVSAISEEIEAHIKEEKFR